MEAYRALNQRDKSNFQTLKSLLIKRNKIQAETKLVFFLLATNQHVVHEKHQKLMTTTFYDIECTLSGQQLFFPQAEG